MKVQSKLTASMVACIALGALGFLCLWGRNTALTPSTTPVFSANPEPLPARGMASERVGTASAASTMLATLVDQLVFSESDHIRAFGLICTSVAHGVHTHSAVSMATLAALIADSRDTSHVRLRNVALGAVLLLRDSRPNETVQRLGDEYKSESAGEVCHRDLRMRLGQWPHGASIDTWCSSVNGAKSDTERIAMLKDVFERNIMLGHALLRELMPQWLASANIVMLHGGIALLIAYSQPQDSATIIAEQVMACGTSNNRDFRAQQVGQTLSALAQGALLAEGVSCPSVKRDAAIAALLSAFGPLDSMLGLTEALCVTAGGLTPGSHAAIQYLVQTATEHADAGLRQTALINLGRVADIQTVLRAYNRPWEPIPSSDSDLRDKECLLTAIANATVQEPTQALLAARLFEDALQHWTKDPQSRVMRQSALCLLEGRDALIIPLRDVLERLSNEPRGGAISADAARILAGYKAALNKR